LVKEKFKMEKIKITQLKSSIGTIPGHRKTLRALGLRKIGSSRIHSKSPAIMGMIRDVNYLVSVEKA
jgi:large subunit ribosomal protein L30